MHYSLALALALLQSHVTSVMNHPEDWNEYIRNICMAYNTSKYPTTGFTPFHLMFGRQAQLPVDLMYGSPNLEAVLPSQYKTSVRPMIKCI